MIKIMSKGKWKDKSIGTKEKRKWRLRLQEEQLKKKKEVLEKYKVKK